MAGHLEGLVLLQLQKISVPNCSGASVGDRRWLDSLHYLYVGIPWLQKSSVPRKKKTHLSALANSHPSAARMQPIHLLRRRMVALSKAHQ